MSRAIASARQRRAGISSSEPPPIPAPPQQTLQSQQGGLTLPQVISLVDSRLIKLEKFMKESQSQQNEKIATTTELIQSEPNINSSIIGEFESRFDLLAQELMQLKNIVLKLQSYTMEVNKQLLQEKELILDINKQLLDEREELIQSEEVFNIQTVEEEKEEVLVNSSEEVVLPNYTDQKEK